MPQPINPRLIPPPLPHGSRKPARSVTQNDTVETLLDAKTRNSIAGIFIALVILMLLLALFFISGVAGGGKGDKLGSPDSNGPVEGVLEGKNETGDTLENGQDDKTRVQQGVPDKDQSADRGSEVQAEDVPIHSPNDNSQPSEKSSTEQNEDSAEAKEKPVVLSRVPNRQAQAGNGMSSTRGGTSSGQNGTDLSSSKGMNPFVGEGKPAASTVFVIDVSGSMQNPGKLPRVMNALSRAIDQLKDNQKVCVLLFDNFYFSDPSLPGLVPANKKNRERIQAWLAMPQGGGGTEPMAAMVAAITLNPERIVLLSDGEFDPSNIQTITMLNSNQAKPARIDCVGLMEQVIVLQEIAKANHGIYYQAW
jgi:Mg-chelatase subunit ChlD